MAYSLVSDVICEDLKTTANVLQRSARNSLSTENVCSSFASQNGNDFDWSRLSASGISSESSKHKTLDPLLMRRSQSCPRLRFINEPDGRSARVVCNNLTLESSTGIYRNVPKPSLSSSPGLQNPQQPDAVVSVMTTSTTTAVPFSRRNYSFKAKRCMLIDGVSSTASTSLPPSNASQLVATNTVSDARRPPDLSESRQDVPFLRQLSCGTPPFAHNMKPFMRSAQTTDSRSHHLPVAAAENASSAPITSERHGYPFCRDSPRLRKDQFFASVLPLERPSRLAIPTVQENAAVRLRKIMIHSELHRFIPEVIADWPATNLRLCSIISPDECKKIFSSMDRLWSLLFHGLLIRRHVCRLRCLDFAEFVPNKALLYTTLQLIPLLSYNGTLDIATIRDTIITQHNIEDKNLLENLTHLLQTLLSHSVLRKGQKLYFKEPLEIIIDNFPLAADNLAFYGWLISSSVNDVTKVNINIRSVHFSYKKPGPEFLPIDPILPLQVFGASTNVKNLESVYINRIPTKRAMEIIASSLVVIAENSSKLKKMALFDTNLTIPPYNKQFVTLLTKCALLTILDLSGCNVSRLLGSVLASISLPLREITLSGVYIGEEDIMALLSSKHASVMRKVNLSKLHSNQCLTCRSSADDDGSSGGHSYNKESLKLNETPSADRRMSSRHRYDADLYLTLFANLHKLENIKVLHVTSTAFGRHPIDTKYLSVLLCSLQKLSLCELNMEGIPLSETDILSLISLLSKMPLFQSLSVTRSKVHDHSKNDNTDFGGQLHSLTNGKSCRISLSDVS